MDVSGDAVIIWAGRGESQFVAKQNGIFVLGVCLLLVVYRRLQELQLPFEYIYSGIMEMAS